jgi:putative sterol carrier protein
MSEQQAIPEEYLEDPERYFTEWIPQLLRDVDGARAHFGKVKAVAQFHLTGERGGQWYFDMGKGSVAVAAGSHARPSFTLTMPVRIWQQMNRGELSGTRAYFRGDLKFKGSWLKFIRVAKLFS